MHSVFQHCPFLVRESTVQDMDKLIAQWKSHKYSKPVRGGIILSQDLTKVCSIPILQQVCLIHHLLG